MSPSILQNALPSLSAHVIPRSNALKALTDAFTQVNIVFLHAPCGYGKTTLIREYVDQKQCPFQYLSFNGKTEPQDFWPHFFLAIKRLDYGLGEKLESLLEVQTEPEFIKQVIEKLNKASTSIHSAEGSLIIIDDAHNLDDALLLQFNLLLDQQPKWLRLFISSQTPVQLDTSIRQAKGTARVFNQDILKLSPQQSQQLFNKQDANTHLESNKQKSNQLIELGNGWPGIINILAGDNYQAQSTAQLSFGSNLYHFLEASIFNTLDLQTIGFLEAISMLDSFNTQILMSLLLEHKQLELKPKDIQQLLINCIDKGLIEKTDNIETPFNVPKVIKQFSKLNYLLDPNNSDYYRAQKQKARDQYIQQGSLTQALTLSINLHDWPKASNLLLKLGQAFLQNGDIEQAQSLLNSFPAEFIYTQPFLCLLKSLLYISSYEQQQARLFMDCVEQHLSELKDCEYASDKMHELGLEDQSDLQTLVNAHHILYGLMQRFTLGYQNNQATSIAPSFDSNNPLSSNHFLCWQYFSHTIDAFINDDINTCVKQGQYALSLAKDIGDYSCMVASAGWLLHGLYYQGHVNQALELAHDTLAFLQERNALDLANMHNLYGALCFLHIEKNELDQAWYYYEKVKSSIGAYTDPREVLYSRYYLQLTLLSASMKFDELETALFELGQYQANIEEKSNQAGIEDFSILFNHNLISSLMELRNKNAFPLMQWAMSEFDEDDISTTPCLFRFYYESFLHVVGKSFAGMDLSDELQSIIEHSQKNGVLGRCINAYMFKARVLFNQGDESGCESILSLALPKAKQAGYMSLLIDDPAIQSLFEFAQQKNIETQYCAQLLHALQVRQTYQPPHLRAQPEPIQIFAPTQQLFDSLTPREKEVLVQLSQGARNKELAENLGLSVATVKRHLQNIYGKLQVSSRTEAILLVQPLLDHSH